MSNTITTHEPTAHSRGRRHRERRDRERERDPRRLGEPDIAVDVAGLTKRYGTQTVVDGVSFRVRRGEVFGLLGANGAGKTTTVECLQGLRQPDSGAMTICGLHPGRDRRALSGIVGSQLQESGLPDRLRVGEAVRLFARNGAAPTDEVLATWGLTQQRRTAYASLSGGQRQRLMVALALLNRPEVVFLDELTQGLDPAARSSVWELIRELRNAGTTVVLVTHFMDEAEQLCDRVAVMTEGRIVGTGTPTDLVEEFGFPMRMTFSRPPDLDLDGLARLPGVRSVDVVGSRVEVRGDTSLVAHVGAALVSVGVPTDLDVHQSGLEDVLVPILGGMR